VLHKAKTAKQIQQNFNGKEKLTNFVNFVAISSSFFEKLEKTNM